MGKGSSTTTQTNQPPSEYLYGYNVALQQAQNAADQPYQNYNGQLVAGFNPTQQAAFSNISGMGNTVQPYINQAQNYFGQATQPLVSSIPTMDSGTLSGLGSSGLALNQQSTGNFSSVPTFDTSQIPSYNPQYQFNPNSIPQFSAQAVNQYQSPYTQSVVNATQAQFNNQNAQQLQQLRGNAVSAGAFGGDREAVAEGILGGQQQQAQAPVIAGLENQGYSQALGEFNTQQQSNIQAQEQAASLGQQQAATATGLGIQEQATGAQLGLSRAQALTQAQQQAAAQQFGLLQGQQQTELGANEANAWLASQAGFGSAQLGQEALNSGLSYNQALYGVGALQQQQEQEGLNVPYEQWAAQQAYPFQTTGWLANVAEGLGGSAGGTSSTTSPSSGNSLSSIAGLGTAAVGTLGATGAFGSSGWLTGSAASGAANSLAAAPAAVSDTSAVFDAADAADAVSLWRRGGRIPHRGPGGLIPDTAPVSASPMVGGSMPVSGAAPVAAASPVGMAAPASAASPAGLAAPVDSSAPVGLATPDGSGVPNASQSMVPALAASGSSGQKSSKIIQGFKDAGTTTTTQGPAFPAYMSVPAWLGDPGNNLILQNVGGPQAVDTFYRGALAAGKVAASFFLKKGGRVSGLLPHFDDGGQVGNPGDTQGFGIVPPADADNTPGLSPPSSVPMQQRLYHPDPWVPLMMAGFGMMGGRSRNATENIGQGAMAGLGEYAREQKEGTSEQLEAERLHNAVLEQKQRAGLIGEQTEAAHLQNQMTRTLMPAQMALAGFGPGQGGASPGGQGAPGPVSGGAAGASMPQGVDATWDRMIGVESGGNQLGQNGQPLMSPKGAIGRAQIMPATAQMVAQQIGVPYDENRLKNDANYNTVLGKAYFDQQVKNYGNVVLASAAYNAGPDRVNQWIGQNGDPRTGQVSASDWANRIPIKETRDYVWNTALAGGQQDSSSSPSGARSEIMQLKTMQRIAIARGDMKTAAGLENRMSEIGGKGTVIDQSGNIVLVPGATDAAFSMNRAAGAGSEAGKFPYQAQLKDLDADERIRAAGGAAAARAPYQEPITTTVVDPQTGLQRQVIVPRPTWAAATAQPGVAPNPATLPGTVQGKQIFTPEQEDESKAYGDVSKQIIEAGNKAPVSLQRLDVIQNAASSFRPGMSGPARLAAGRAMTDALQSIGITPPSWISTGAAAGETIGKEGGYLASEMTRALGSREAAVVFNQIRTIQPNIEMSQGGFQAITNSIRQGLQRDQDLANYREQWVSGHGGSIRGMTDAFNRDHPVEAYASRVVPYPMPKSQGQAIPNVIYQTQRGQALWDGTKFVGLQ